MGEKWFVFRKWMVPSWLKSSLELPAASRCLSAEAACYLGFSFVSFFADFWHKLPKTEYTCEYSYWEMYKIWWRQQEILLRDIKDLSKGRDMFVSGWKDLKFLVCWHSTLQRVGVKSESLATVNCTWENLDTLRDLGPGRSRPQLCFKNLCWAYFQQKMQKGGWLHIPHKWTSWLSLVVIGKVWENRGRKNDTWGDCHYTEPGTGETWSSGKPSMK